MALPGIDRIDTAVGDGIERAMLHHHLRRLRRHGHLSALAPAVGICVLSAEWTRKCASDSYWFAA